MLMRVANRMRPLKHRSNQTVAKTTVIEKTKTRNEEAQLVPLAPQAQKMLMRKAKTTADRLRIMLEPKPTISRRKIRVALHSSKP
jgi:hypothetical protein